MMRLHYTSVSVLACLSLATGGFAHFTFSVDPFSPEVPDCQCSLEMSLLGTHTLGMTPCSEDVNFGVGETCLGNGGIEGPRTVVTFEVFP